ncbi:hypothetical protein Pmani_002999 [Petrolisthes manimaculis]|uniref:Uncharacterized protein n=1 Tax=Petrolisthes manimaculis TaxID=1843537 RepID=A0AAE1QJD2_9EUCA|nr:hypothetical protein Pmani_002999 [Petrolisthes manimaculis]
MAFAGNRPYYLIPVQAAWDGNFFVRNNRAIHGYNNRMQPPKPFVNRHGYYSQDQRRAMMSNTRSVPLRNALYRALTSGERGEPLIEHTDEYRFNAMMEAARQEAKRKAVERTRQKAIDEANLRKTLAKEAARRKAMEEEARRRAIQEAARRREKEEKDAKRKTMRDIVRRRAIEAGEAYSHKKVCCESSTQKSTYESPQNKFKRNTLRRATTPRPHYVNYDRNVTLAEENLKNGLEVDKGNGAVLSINGSPDGPNGAVVKSGRYSYTEEDGTTIDVSFVADEIIILTSLGSFNWR